MVNLQYRGAASETSQHMYTNEVETKQELKTKESLQRKTAAK